MFNAVSTPLYTRDILRLQIGRHLIADEPDITKKRRRNSRIWRIEEWRDRKP